MWRGSGKEQYRYQATHGLACASATQCKQKKGRWSHMGTPGKEPLTAHAPCSLGRGRGIQLRHCLPHDTPAFSQALLSACVSLSPSAEGLPATSWVNNKRKIKTYPKVAKSGPQAPLQTLASGFASKGCAFLEEERCLSEHTVKWAPQSHPAGGFFPSQGGRTTCLSRAT